jgi:putative membrane protein
MDSPTGTNMFETNNPNSTPQAIRAGPPESDPRVFLAVERTFLAWIRTGLAMMGFGFVVARFGVFLREIAAAQPINPEASAQLSLWFGTALVIIGTVVNLIAALQHVHVIRRLNRGVAHFARPSAIGVTVALVLAALGAAMVGYLVVLGR